MNMPIRDALQITGVSLLKTHAQEIASTDGSSVDLGAASYQGMVFVAYLVTNANPTGETHDLVIEGSNDDSTWETVATFAQWDLSTAAGLYRVDFDYTKGPKRYYRYSSTQSASADVTYSVWAIGIAPTHAPVAQV
jgi:hypothetical protein